MVDRERSVKTGDIAGDFTLKDQDGNDFNLYSKKGQRVLLSFHPLAWTPVCTRQMQSLEDNVAALRGLNTAPIGMSVDPQPSKKAWADSIGVKQVPLLSDFWPHGEVARLFDIFREKNGFSERANILVDETGRIAFLVTYPLSQLPDIQEVMQAIKRL